MTTYYNYYGTAMKTSGAPTTWLKATSSNQTVSGVAGNNSLTDSEQSGITLVGGTGDNTYTVGTNGTLGGWSGTIIQQAASGTNTVVAYASYALPVNIEVGEVYGAGHYLVANSQGDLLIAEGAGPTLVSGSGADVLVGYSTGANTFVFPTNSGYDTVYNFVGTGSTPDTIDLNGYNFTSFAQVQAAMNQQGANVLLTLDANDAVLFEGVTLASFTASNFVLNGPSQYYDFYGIAMQTSGTAAHAMTAATASQTLTGAAGGTTLSDNGLTGVTLVGGSGNNTYTVYSSSTAIQQGTTGINTVNAYVNYTLPANIQVGNVYGAYTLTANGAGDLLTAANAGATLVSGAGADVMVASSSGGDALVFASGSGYDTVYNFIGTGSTHDTIDLNGYFTSFAQVQAAMTQQGANVLLTLDGYDAVLFENTTLSSFVAGDFVLNGVAAAAYDNFYGVAMNTSGAPGSSLSATAAGQTITGVAGNNLLSDGGFAGVILVGGTGDDTFTVNASSTIIQAGPGVDTVNAYVNYALPANVEVGNVFGAFTLIGNNQGDLLTAETSGATLVSGAGNDALVGYTGGGDTFVFAQNTGHDAVYNFVAGSGSTHDTVDLNGYAFTSFAQVQAAMVQQGSNVLLTLDANDAILFENTTLANFVAADFLLNSSSLYYNFYGLPMKRSGGATTSLTASAAGQTLTGGAGNNQLNDGSKAGVVLVGGTGDNTYGVDITSVFPDETATVVQQGASGTNTVDAFANYALPANIEVALVYGHHSVIANNQGDLLFAENSWANLVAGAGNDVLVGNSAGDDRFVFNAGSGHDVVYSFMGGTGSTHDWIELNGYGFTSFSQVQQAMTQQGSDVLLTLDANDAILIKNTTVAALNASDFLLNTNQSQLSTLAMSFDDEFNSLSLFNSSTYTGTWKTSFYFGNPNTYSSRTCPANGELELYVDPSYAGTGTTALGLNPFSVNNGVVSITANPTPAADLAALNNYQYYSGLLTTQNSFSQLYGYFEIRAQLPSGKGMWPAFWLLPTNLSTPQEIDVMEQLGGNTIYQTVHSSISGDTQQMSNYLPNLTSGYHTFGVLWTAESITWYIDGAATFSVATPADLNTPMYMLLNLAVGGSWPGNPTSASEFPASFNIDYVHAYSLAQLNSAGIGAPIQTFTGKGVSDTFVVDNSADNIVEPVNTGTNTVDAAVNYTLPANLQNLTMMGNASLIGTGNSLNNVITGNAGEDTLNGMGGSNTLVAESADTTFLFNTLTNVGTDIVENFKRGCCIDISAFTAAGYTPTLSNSGSNMLITFSTGEVIQVDGVSTSQVVLYSNGRMMHT
jgi:beta-glucanase (GH16 family)